LIRTLPFAAVVLAALVLAASPSDAADMRFIRDAEIEADLKALSTPIFDRAGLSPDTVKFVLVENTTLNAFVAGGQNIFLHTGLILDTDTPAELQGVIAHETGHISAGHLFRSQAAMEDAGLQVMLANILGIAAAIGTRTSGVGMAISSAGQTYAMRTALRHSRIQETAADEAGLRFLKESGIATNGFLSFMEKLSSQYILPESQQSEYVRTHPLTEDRVDFLRHEIENDKQREAPAAWVDMHARIKAKLLGYLNPDRALQDRGTGIASRYGHAIAYYRQARIDKALGVLETLLTDEPQNPYFHELRGQILFESGKIPEAISSYRKAVKWAPQSGLIRAAYGHALVEEGDMDSAIAELTKALQSEPRMSESQHLLAIAYGRKGDEGQSRLHLAEEALLQGKKDVARLEAQRALKSLPQRSAGRLRAQDILDTVAQKDGKKGEKDKNGENGD
jgi:predicted Zn-dependent protease